MDTTSLTTCSLWSCPDNIPTLQSTPSSHLWIQDVVTPTRKLAREGEGRRHNKILCNLASPLTNNIPIIWTTVEQQYFNYSQSLDIQRRPDINLQHQDLLFCLFQAAKCRIERLHPLALSQEEWRACPHRHIYIMSAVKSQISSIQHTDSSSGP